MRTEFPDVEHWFADYFLNTVLSGRFKPAYHQIALGVIRRSQHAFFRYHEARERTLEFLSRTSIVDRQVRLFFKALDSWETFVLQSAMAIDLLVAFADGDKVFAKGDGSAMEQLYCVSNQIKHHSSCIESGQAAADHTVPLWLSNEGLCSFERIVPFSDAGAGLSELSRMAVTLKNPVGLAAPVSARGDNTSSPLSA